jgi:hypothetical protein
MVSGRASREIRQQKVTERRVQVARAQATRQVVRIGTVVVLLVAAIAAAAIYFLA